MRRVIVVVLLLAGCAAPSDPTPAPGFDGRYTGTRQSHDAAACGLAEAHGRTSATVRHGSITLALFGPRSVLDGSVGEDGRVRASGIWSTGRSFPIVTVLHGRIAGGTLTGTATDLRCVTDIVLHRLRVRPRPATLAQ